MPRGAPFILANRGLSFLTILLFLLIIPIRGAPPAEAPKEITEILEYYCYDCHGFGKKEGGFSLEELSPSNSEEELHAVWEKAWLNIRTGLMPPSKADAFLPEEKQQLMSWLESQALDLDRTNPDPGRVTVRRHNRFEYENIIQDLFNVSIDTAELFPPDDTGYGFDTIGDILNVSPPLIEKYLSNANDIMAQAVPINAGRYPQMTLSASSFQAVSDSTQKARKINLSQPASLSAQRWIPQNGTYQVQLSYQLKDFPDPIPSEGKNTIQLRIGAETIIEKEISWATKNTVTLKNNTKLLRGQQKLLLSSITPEKAFTNSPNLRLESITLIGPLEGPKSQFPQSYRQVISEENHPRDRNEWPEKMTLVMKSLAERAWRRPVPDQTLDALSALALAKAEEAEAFEIGVRRGGAAILSSPRFLLRTEFVSPSEPANAPYPLLDDYALASRLSFFLWSSLPDERLTSLAKEGKLLANWDSEVNRLLADEKSNRFIHNFGGQWLHAHDINSVSINAHVILRKSFREGNRTFSRNIRKDMRAETDAYLRYLIDESRPATELINSNYTFLNDRLAKFYGLPPISGRALRKVIVPPERGGFLTQGTFLVSSSNPSRTSPVKRGLFVLENILGTPPPPAPPNVSDLPPRAKKNSPTLRELMVIHRENPDCRSCHARMDPIGLAFENYNAIGQYRATDRGKEIDTSGHLVSGENFQSLAELKTILTKAHQKNFHRCLVEKLLIYALGRGLTFRDAPAVDEIVRRMEKKNGSLREAIIGVTESVPFQRRRATQNTP